MQYQNRFPIYRNANRLVVEIEHAVRHFPKYHKYTLGSEIRQTAYDLLIAITYAINHKNNRHKALKKAHDLSEVLKIKIYLAKQITNLQFKTFDILNHLPSIGKNLRIRLTALTHLKQRRVRQLFVANHQQFIHNTPHCISSQAISL